MPRSSRPRTTFIHSTHPLTSQWLLSVTIWSDQVSLSDCIYILRYWVSIQKQPPEVFYEKRCSLNFRRIQGNHLFQSLFFSKVAGLRSATLLKRRLWHRCFPVNFAKFLRTAFLQNTSERLLLCIIIICFPAEEHINFENNISFLSRFPTWPKNSGQKFKYFRSKKSF